MPRAPLGQIHEPARAVDVVHRTDVLVVGSGPAWYRREQTVDAGGIAREFEDRAAAMGMAVPESQSLSQEIDSEGFKVVADVLVEEAGVQPMLHRLVVAPVLDGDAIVGVITESKAGREAILAERVIDASGDADVAHRAGVPARDWVDRLRIDIEYLVDQITDEILTRDPHPSAAALARHVRGLVVPWLAAS